MKKIIFLSLITALLFSACEKNNLNENNVWGYKDPNTALVRFINAYTSLTPSLDTPPKGPSVNFYINNMKMNAAAMAYSSIFPSVSGGGAYAQAPSGEVNIKVVLNRPLGGGIPSDTIVNSTYTLGANAAHSIILVDTFPNPTPSSPILMIANDAISMPVYGMFRVRLINLTPTNDPLEIYFKTSGTVLASNVFYKSLSAWADFPLLTIGDSVFLRKVGTNEVLAKTTTFSPGNQRSITFWARGNPDIVGKPRTLSFFTTQ